MQFTLHATRRALHGALRLVQAMPAWLVKIRRAPSRHSTDARVYGLTTPPPPLGLRLCDYRHARIEYSPPPPAVVTPKHETHINWITLALLLLQRRLNTCAN